MATINRADLQKKLETVAPALADHSHIPILTHFLFTGTKLMAYNDRIAMSVPLESNFKGALPGKILMDIISMSSHATSLTIAADDGKARLRIGKSTELKLGMMPLDDALFKMPALPKQNEGVLADNEFFDALDNCLQSVSNYSTVTDQLGVTLIANGKHIKLFATDRRSLSYARLPMPQLNLKDELRIIMPAEFCKQTLAICKEAKDKQLAIRKDHAIFVADDTVLFGRLLSSDEPLDYENVLRRMLPPKFPQGMAKMDNSGKQAPRLKTAFELSARISDIQGSETKTLIKVSGNVIKMSSVSNRGEIKDEVAVTYHPDIEVAVNSALIRDGYDRYENILLTDKCTVLSSGANSVCIIANM